MQFFGQSFKDDLLTKATISPRKRAHANIHNSFEDKVQRLAISLIRGTYIPPHKHTLSHQWEFFHVIDGEVKLLIFDANGIISDVILLGSMHSNFAVQLPPNTIHTLACISPQAFVFEWKEGPFDPAFAKVMPEWSIPEDADQYKKCVNFLESATIGEQFIFL
jgi:cupin fold WbuC family metalloprotein